MGAATDSKDKQVGYQCVPASESLADDLVATSQCPQLVSRTRISIHQSLCLDHEFLEEVFERPKTMAMS